MTMRSDGTLKSNLERIADIVSETKARHAKTVEVLARSDAAQEKAQKAIKRANDLVAAHKAGSSL